MNISHCILVFFLCSFLFFEVVAKRSKHQPGNWIRNVAKKRRQTGKQYISAKTGRSVSERSVMAVKYSSRCRLKCLEKISREERQRIYALFCS